MSIHRLESAKQFVTRCILLNRFHAPDEEDYEAAGHALGSIHRGFPRAEAHEQAAYIITAIAAAKPFAEANFRTAYDYVADMLAHNDYDLAATLRQQQDLGTRVWGAMEGDGEAAVRALTATWYKARITSLGKGAR
jgi:hypothetical protein